MPKDTSQDFNQTVKMPPKLEKRFKALILRHGSMFENFIPDDVHNDIYPEIYDFFKFTKSYYITRRNIDGLLINEAKEKLEEMTAADHRLCNKIVDIIYDCMINFFSNLSLNESQILSQRTRRNRVKKMREGTFSEISLKPYVTHFIRYLCNSELEPSFSNKNPLDRFSWPREDWDSDALSIIRGYLISKNQNQGKAQFRLEDFDFINVQSRLGENGKINGIKPIAAAFIPAEGADYVRASLATMPDVAQSKLPSIWQNDEGNSVILATDITEPPQADILHADDNYILMHLKNESAAKCFGANPAWCVTYGHWDPYSDNFLFICDSEGYRYGINIRANQCVDQNDLAVNLEDLFEKFNDLKNHILEFYNQQLKYAIKRQNADDAMNVIIPKEFQHFTSREQMISADFVYCHYDVKDISYIFTELLPPENLYEEFNKLVSFYANTPRRKQHFIDVNMTSILFELHRQSKITTHDLFERTTHVGCVFGKKLKEKMSQSWIEYLETDHGKKIKIERPSFKP